MRPARTVGAIAGIVVTILSLVPMMPAVAHPRSNEPPWLNESASCDDPAGILAPMADVADPNAYRGLPADAEVRGPWGGFLGRDLGDVQESLRLWTVPMSGGVKVWVHKRALPAFTEVSRLLAIEQGKGHYYPVRLVGTFSWRRVSGSFRMSHHSFGTTIDINWDANPQLGPGPAPPRSQYTDIPIWFVTAWEKAGFCWGGDWSSNKDPMHFSWKGPAATPGYGPVPKPFPRNTEAAPFTGVDYTFDPGFGPGVEGDAYLIADVSRDGAADAVRLRRIGDDLLGISVAYSSRNFKRCGVEEIRTPPMPFDPVDVGMANLVGDARSDVWVAGNVGGNIEIGIVDLNDLSSGWDVTSTDIKTQWVTSIHFANYNSDKKIDLLTLRHRPGDVRLRVFSGAGGYSSKLLDQVVAIDPGTWPLIDVADRGGDGAPDLLATGPASTVVKVAAGASGFTTVRSVQSGAGPAAASSQFADWDGDGRDDLYSLDSDGSGDVFLGGSGITKAKYWFLSKGWECGRVSFPALPFDFNGDSFADIVAGAPGEDLGSIGDAGAVYVVAGGTSIKAGTGEMWSQTTEGIRNKSETGDLYGTSKASGDFDGDGYADLVVGVPGERLSGKKGAGMVSVLYGSVDGLTDKGDDAWSQATPKVAGDLESGDRFGSAVASGDFDGDGYDDLVVGVPGEGIAGHPNAGTVNIFYGDRWERLEPGGRITQNTAGVPGEAEDSDRFGSALVSADFDGDGYDDIAVGSRSETVGSKPRAGMVHVVFGGPAGLNPASTQMFTAGSAFDKSILQANGLFGDSLAACDVNGDLIAELVIGSPGVDSSGAAIVVEGKPTGLAPSPWPLLVQGPGSLGGKSDPGDDLGDAVACADLNGDGFGEVVIGVPGEDVEDKDDAGMVRIVPGSIGGPDTTAAITISQARPQIWNQPEPSDRFGASLTTADYDHDGAVDLLIGVPGEGIQGMMSAGMVVVVPGRIGGVLALARATALYQGKDLGGVLESDDRTGF